MKKLFTIALFVSGMMLFACEDSSEQVFDEVMPQLDEASLELDQVQSGEFARLGGTIDHDSGF